MVDREIFSRRLEALHGYLSRLRAFRDVPEAEFAISYRAIRDELHDLERLATWAAGKL
jgi:hypothetical protein